MAKNLIVVESPAKAKTLKKYLGKDFDILASYGHVRDLIPKEGAVDPDNGFTMKYQIIEKNAKHVDHICRALNKAEVLYLATDPDREGEAISWHLVELIKQHKPLQNKIIKRIAFHEITKSAVKFAIENPRSLSFDLINAQQARRALDYLVGFNLSPLLWKKIRRGLSAGRVQSPALRMIVERAIEIENFIKTEYWTIEANLQADNKKFSARLIEYQHEKLKQFSIKNESQAKAIKEYLAQQAAGELTVHKITKSQRKRSPAAPFTTSTLQQEAVRKLGFSAQKTMRTAQQLYEGIDIGDETIGLITYMRTDSVNLAQEAIKDIRELIASRYGHDNVPENPQQYKTKAKNAQEAHEAIRPTNISLLPQAIKNYLSYEQYKLYDLIWKRTVACQMVHAIFNLVAIDFICGEGIFRANGSTLVKLGFIQVYQEGQDEGDNILDENDKLLPPLKEGDTVKLISVNASQHFTEPPPSYSEASLVKALEEHGIGRPSTYATIISTLQQREYVIMEQKRFIPTDVGRVVNKFLTNYFSSYVDYNFTARLEDDLDAVARGEKNWIPLMEVFWKPFITLINDVEKSVQRKDVTQEQLTEKCPKCGSALSIRLGKLGRFIGCTSYPGCDYTANITDNSKDCLNAEIIENRKCPDCESNLIIKHGKYGKFIGCTSYPKCRFIESLNKPINTEITCPQCKQGSLLKRKNRRNLFFYSCSSYPKCNYAIQYQPIDEHCPLCSWSILMLKFTKKRSAEKTCPQKTCNFTAPYEYEDKDKD